MPIHDWTSVTSGIYHDFHQDWTIELCRTLNRGLLPSPHLAMVEHRESGSEVAANEAARYAVKANRISIRQGLGRVVSIIELVSPGNKDRKGAVAEFVGKAVEFIRNSVHFLMIDPFPPGRHDPDGLASLIWEQVADAPFPERPAGKPLSVAAFDAGEPMAPYVEGLAVGNEWPMAPLFLAPEWYVEVPLEETYGVSWEVTPGPIREIVEGTVT